jgi:ABC-2 type transport system permease protein
MRREVWESPFAFKWAPLGIGGLILLFTAVMLMISARFDGNMAFTLDAVRLFADLPGDEKRLIVSGFLFATSSLFLQIMVLIILFFLAGSLYDDRKDRSILFWKSLPVSDTLTISSKLATAVFMVPGLFLGAIILTHLALLLIGSGYAVVAGINPFTNLWWPASLPRLWTVMAAGLVVQALWLMPIYAWLLFCSSWAPRLPILIAVAIPAGFSIAQHSYSFITGFQLPEFNLGLIMLKRLGTGVLPGNANIVLDGGMENIQFSEDLYMSFSNVAAHMIKPEMWIGLGIAAALIAPSIFFRRRATDT